MRGEIELYQVRNGVWTPLGVCSNNIVYSGYDAMARAFAGDPDYVVNGMYLEYTNGPVSEPSIPLDRTAAYYPTLSDPYGYIRFRTTATPAHSSSDPSKYKANIVTFIGVTEGPSEGGADLVDGTSQMISLALVAMPKMKDQTMDTLVSAAPIKAGGTFAPVTKMANSQMGFKWSLTLGD